VEKTGSLNLSYRVTQGKVRIFMLDRQILHPPGYAERSRSNWHMHVFVIQHRWQKAWIYMILRAKNLAVIAATGIRGITGHRSTSERNTLST
jgi:hypothetical protein